jgi:hypothetical protein
MQKEAIIARQIRARGLVGGHSAAEIAAAIHDECEPSFGTTWVRAYRLAAGIALADIVEQVKAWYQHEGRGVPKFSETLLSAYESGHKRPGTEYLHYLCSVYRADPVDLGYATRCLCGRSHRGAVLAGAPAPTGREVRGVTPSSPGGGSSGSGNGCHAGRQDPRIDGTVQGADAHGGAAGPATAGGPGGRADPGGPCGVTTSTAISGSVHGHFGDTGEEYDDVLRRTLLGLIAGASVALDSRLIGAIDGIRRRLDGALLSSGVAATTLDHWEEATAGYGRQYMTVPPPRLLCDVLLDLSDVRRMCETRQSIEAQERLCRLAAHLSALVGMTMIDIGDHRLARSFFRTARTAADETGDRVLRAWVVAREGLVPLYYGDSREALRLARVSQDLAGRTPCAAGALAPMIEARALAKAGHGHPDTAQQVARAIGRAQAVFVQLTDEQRASTAFGYTKRQMLFHQGEALAGLGADDADAVLAEALAAYPASEHLDRSLIRFDRAMCQLVRGEVEEAVRIGEETISGLPPDYRPEIVIHRARDLVTAAVARSANHPRVRRLRDHLATMRPAVSL